MRLTRSDACGHKTDNSPTTCRRATFLGSAGLGVIEWDGTQSDDGGGVGGVALGWVFAVEGGTRVHVHRDSQGVMRGGWNESGWVGIGESLTLLYKVTDPLNLTRQTHTSAFKRPKYHHELEEIIL